MNEKQQKILFITRSSEEGGEAVFIQKLKELLKSDHIIRTCSLLGDEGNGDRQTSFMCPKYFLNKPFITFDSLRILSNEIKNADIVEHFAFGIYSLIFFFLAQFYNKKTIVTFHTNLESKRTFKYLYDLILKFVIINYFIIFTHKFVFITNYQMVQFRKFCIFKKRFDLKSSYVHNFIEKKHILRKEKKFGNQIKVIFVGRLTKAKGFDLYMNVASHYINSKEVTFLAIGKGSDKWSIIPKNISIIDTVNNSNIYKYYNMSDILIMSSRGETFGLVILEAMAKGLLVLASRLGPVEEFFVHENNGYLFKVGDVSKVVLLLNKIIEDRHLLSEISRFNLSFVSKFTEDCAKEKFIKIYDF